MTPDTSYTGTPYLGMAVGKLTFDATAADNAAGTYSWKVALKPLAKGENTVTVVFTPADTDHYETTETDIKITAVRWS